MKAPRAGTRKAAIFRAYVSGGGEAEAFSSAARLNIKPGTVRSWIGSWSKDKVEAATPRVRIPRRNGAWNEGSRVCLSYDDDSKGTVLRKGPEVSSIKFDDRTERFIPNNHIVETGD